MADCVLVALCIPTLAGGEKFHRLPDTVRFIGPASELHLPAGGEVRGGRAPSSRYAGTTS